MAVTLLDLFDDTNGTLLVAHRGAEGATSWEKVGAGVVDDSTAQIQSGTLLSTFIPTTGLPYGFRCRRDITTADYGVRTTFTVTTQIGQAFPAIRMPTGTNTAANARGYFIEAESNSTNTTLYLRKVATAGAGIGSVVTPKITSGTFTCTLSAAGSTISVTMQRASDGFYLNSSGAWQSGATTCISVTDTTFAGPGYAGLTVGRSSVATECPISVWEVIDAAIVPPSMTPTLYSGTAAAGETFELDLTGVSTSWVLGVSSLSVSGVPGVTILDSYIADHVVGWLQLQAGAYGGTLTITDGEITATFDISGPSSVALPSPGDVQLQRARREALLGRGGYRVIASETMTGLMVVDLTRYVTSGSWFNALNGPGSGTAGLTGVDTETLERVALLRGGAHELTFFREGHPIFVGPLTTRPVISDRTATLSAQTMDIWLDMRFARYPLAENAGLSAQTFLRLMIESGLSVSDPRLMAHIHYLTNSQIVTNEAVDTTKYPYVSEVLRPLVGSVFDYSVHGRRITYFPFSQSLGYLGSLNDSMIAGQFSVDRPLRGFASRAAIRTGTGRDQNFTIAEATNPWGILVERRFDAGSNASEVADSKVTSDVPLRTAVGADSPVTLSPRAPWRGEMIEAGMTLTLHSSECGETIAVPVRITRVGASWEANAEGTTREQFQIGVEQWRGTEFATV